MILLIAAALARAEPCAPAMAVALVPAPGAVDVPVDIELAAAIDTGCGLAADSWTFEVLLGDAVVHSESVPYVGGNRLASVPAEPLLADTAYTFRVTPDGGSGEATEAGFTTGDQPAEALSGVPEIALIEGTWYASADSLSVSATLEPAPYPEELTMVGVALASGGPVLSLSAGGGSVWLSLAQTAPIDTFCAIPVQWSASGERVEGEEACGPVQTVRDGVGRGCDASGVVPTAFPALLALLAFRRRR